MPPVLVAAAAMRLMQERDLMEDNLWEALARVDAEFTKLRNSMPGFEDSVDTAHYEVRCQFIQDCRKGQQEADAMIASFMAEHGLES